MRPSGTGAQATDLYTPLLVRANGRLRFNLSVHEKMIKIAGSVDRTDKFEFPLFPPADQAEPWAQSFNEQIRILAR